jgi:hypothetical protein
MLLKTLKEATANQTPKKARKSAGAKAEDQYAMAGQPGYVNIAPKYEAFTSMMAQFYILFVLQQIFLLVINSLRKKLFII